VESFQALAHCITKFLLDSENRGRLEHFDAQLLELLILIVTPLSQCFASRAWALLSLERRQCLDLILQLRELVEQKLPMETESSHPLLRELEVAAAHLEKVFFFLNYVV
jgi:hypothetical protein